MKIPTKLKIGGFEWKVEDSKDISEEGNCFGSTHYRYQKIYLEPNIPEQKREQALLHEILHAVWWQQGLSSQELNKYHEEVVDALSMGLYQVLKDNDLNFKGER